MKKVWIIARKELLSTLRQRNLILIMFLSPIVLVTIIGLALSGLGGTTTFADIPVAVVNLDAGLTLPEGNSLSLFGVELGELAAQNLPANPPPGAADGGDLSLNFGDQIAAILLSQPVTGGVGFLNLDQPSCPLLPSTDADTQTNAETAAPGAWSLDALLEAEAVADPDAARAGVASGEYVAAVIIPPDFSRRFLPTALHDQAATAQADASATGTVTGTVTDTNTIEVFANPASTVSATIVRAVVEGIVAQFERVSVAVSALFWTLEDNMAALDMQADGSLTGAGAATLPTVAQGVDASVLEPVGCLLTQQAGAVQIVQQPIDQAQEQSLFSILMVVIGGAQAVFFALFTGVFGINAIYEDRIQGTLQRLLVTPTPSGVILAGRLVGNLVIVMTQLLVLLLAFAAIASLVEGEWRFIWGNHLPALLLVVFGLSLFATGLGVLIVGLAKSSEQVQLIGPAITIVLGMAGGSFGFTLPRQIAQVSPIWWGLDAMRKLAGNESDIGLHLVMLFAAGIVFAGVGTFFFRRRMGL